MGKRNIVLIGLSGSGKTTLGRMAAQKFGMPFVDVDEEIEAQAGMPIGEIFRRHGEQFFRELETEKTKEAARRCGSVISTGGGVVTREENMRALRENGLAVFLDRPPEMIVNEIDSGNRPMLAGGVEKLYILSEERRPLYIRFSDIALPNSGGEAEAFAALEAIIRGESPDVDFAVVGDPIMHSLSPFIHGVVLGSLGANGSYEAIHVARGNIGEFVDKARKSGLKGFNVTIPHKKDIVAFLDSVDEEARLCGAVNTVANREGKLYGFNTDMQGLLEALKTEGSGFAERNVTVLGTGGAAGAIAFKAAREGAASVTVLGRRVYKAEEICENIKSAPGKGDGKTTMRAGAMDMESLAEAASGADILINATPLGMSGIGEDFASLEFLKRLPREALVCDIVYKPPRTNLLREAASLGLKTQNGLGMLIYQALLADELFLDRKLDKPALYKIVSDALARKIE